MHRLLPLLVLALALGLMGPARHASAGVADPWHTVKNVPVPDAAPPPGAGLVGNWGPDITADGQYVAFIGGAPANYPGCVSNACLVYMVIDTTTGATDPVGLAYGGQSILNLLLPSPTISDDGRYVAAGDMWFDRQTHQSERFDVNSQGTPETVESFGGEISGDGRYVAFISTSDTLGPVGQCMVGNSMTACRQAFVHDTQTGDTEMVSVTSDGHPADGTTFTVSISYDGRYVAFYSGATNLSPEADCTVPAQNRECNQVYVHDRQTGETALVSVTPGGAGGNADSITPAISDDGRFVAFASSATDLVGGDSNNQEDVFVRDLQAGTTERVDVTSSGGETQGNASRAPVISADGSRIAFLSDSDTLDPLGPQQCNNNTVTCTDVFVRERASGQTFKVDVSATGEDANARASFPAISADGRKIVYISSADNLVTDVDHGIFFAERDNDFTWGDFDCSGAINIGDALHLLLAQLGVYTAPPTCPPSGTATVVDAQTEMWADFDCNGGVGPADIVPVLQYVVGLTASDACPALGLPAAPEAA